MTECSDLDDSKWELAFWLCAQSTGNGELTEMLRKQLQNVGIDVNENFAETVSTGFLCTCSIQQCENLTTRENQKVGVFWVHLDKTVKHDKHA